MSKILRECTAGIPALRRLRQEDWEFKTRLDYTVKLCLQKINQSINK
jgi:hypothetical protein